MRTLTHYIYHTIQAEQGCISFAQFMQLALYHPKWGYYNSENFTIGKQGDFTTAPELTPLFARCLAYQCLPIFNQLGHANILEFGAGTGRLAMDLLSALATYDALPAHYYIVEPNLMLQQQQQTFLQIHCPAHYARCQWLTQLPEQFSGVMLANEVLDALPVHCFQVQGRHLQERGVGIDLKVNLSTLDQNPFLWQLCAPLHPQLAEEGAALIEQYHLVEDYQSEICLQLSSFIQTAAKALTEGVMLLMDYGYGRAEYYHPQRQQGTLTCFHQHHYHHNPLLLPGQQDITAHVDFTRVIEAAVLADCTLIGYTSQAAFLLACGLIDFAEEEIKSLTPVAAFQLQQAIKLLTWPTEMGERVKVMALGKNIDLPLIGFSKQDRRREL
ncbi:MAG TPA: SAM-dependent methyltransferase [Gammaproteobacteria bacterium]|nr:SAM-dependent methyltransferase [Gammaproteobacteria bacterium]